MKKKVIDKAIEIISSGKKQAQEALKDNKISKDEYNNYMKQLNKALDKAPKFKYKDPPKLKREDKEYLKVINSNKKKDMFKNYSKGGRLNDGAAFIKSLYKDKL